MSDATTATVVLGDVVTMDPERPRARAVAYRGDTLLAVGDRAEAEAAAGPEARTVDLRDACVLPGFVEAHGHPVNSAVLLGEHVTDIRPVTVPTADAVMDALRRAVAERAPGPVYANGWDPLLQRGLAEPNRAALDALAPGSPLVILHNSGHAVYFNSAAADAVGLTRDTPDPVGAAYGRGPDGELDGRGHEAAAVLTLLDPLFRRVQAAFPQALGAECARLNAAGITTVSEMAFNPGHRSVIDAAAAQGLLTARLRLYEMSTPELTAHARPGEGDDLVRQVGVKLWCDGSPWTGNIALSFPYLDTDATRSMGLPPGHRGAANYTPEQLDAISEAYFPDGWQIACHAHGDAGIDTVLDVWEGLLERHPRPDHRLRLEHVGAMRPDQFARARRMGVTCSVFVDHLRYWGDVLVDGLFGPERGAHWASAGSAAATGMRISFHNDGWVTPSAPLSNIAEAASRLSPSGRVLAPEERLPVEAALRAQTIDAAWQLFADDRLGSITPGKLADLVVLERDPTDVAEPQDVAGLRVLATVMGGRTVHGELR